MRLSAYLRHSKDETGTKDSPEVQLEAISECAVRQGHEIVTVTFDLVKQ
jgi:DNA invertase Pin-like site-specific DNA recombinase